LRRPAFRIAALVSLVLAAPFFLVPEEGRPLPPAFALAEKLTAQSPAVVAAALGQEEAALVAALQAAGYETAPGQSLAAMAAASGKTERDLQALLAGLGGGA
jgi:hypothetical protein